MQNRIGAGAVFVALLLWGMLGSRKIELIRMKIISCIVFALTLAVGSAPTFGAEKPETPHLAFVTEYVRELAAIEDIRASGEKELEQGNKDEALSNGIHASTLIQLELRSQIPDLTGFYQHKIALHQKLIDISSAFVSGPKPGG